MVTKSDEKVEYLTKSLVDLVEELTHLNIAKQNKVVTVEDKIDNLEKVLLGHYSSLTDRLTANAGMDELHKNETFLKFQERIHLRIDETQKQLSNVNDVQKSAEIKIKTVFSVIAIVWVVFGSIVGWVWDKSTNTLDNYVQNINNLQEQLRDQKVMTSKLNDEITSLKSTKSQLLTLQADVEDLQRSVYKKGNNN